MKRRYLVKAVASSPMWTGTLWATACAHLSSAEALFERKLEDGDAMLLIDREERKVLRSVGFKDPEQGMRFFGGLPFPRDG
jgi:hypothetical protein